MQEDIVVRYFVERRILVLVILLGIVAIFSPFAVLRNEELIQYRPYPPGWTSHTTIYLWGHISRVAGPITFTELYSLGGGVTNTDTLPFVIMTLIYFVIQIAVSMRRLQAKFGVAIGIVLFLIWVSVGQLIYGSLQDWTLIQIPLLPIFGISILLVAYMYQHKR